MEEEGGRVLRSWRCSPRDRTYITNAIGCARDLTKFSRPIRRKPTKRLWMLRHKMRVFLERFSYASIVTIDIEQSLTDRVRERRLAMDQRLFKLDHPSLFSERRETISQSLLSTHS